MQTKTTCKKKLWLYNLICKKQIIFALKNGLIAQLVEQLTLNQLVLGSSPSGPNKKPHLSVGFFINIFSKTTHLHPIYFVWQFVFSSDLFLLF